MVNKEQLKRLFARITAWNLWREAKIWEKIDLQGANLSNVDLTDENLRDATFAGATYGNVDLEMGV